MAEKTYNARVKWKRDTSANWTSNDPVLLNGEIIIVDTSSGETRFKIGDGVKKYSQLPFEDEAVRSLIDNKVSKESGKVLSSNDYTDTEKEKLAGIATGANKTTVDSALSSTSTNPVQNKVINSALAGKAASSHTHSVSNISGLQSALDGKAESGHTHSVATDESDGFMASEDKAKLDGIASGANKYTHPAYTSRSSGLYKMTVDSSGHVSAVSAVTKADITALGIPGSDTNTTYSAFKGASSSAEGGSGLVPAPAAGASNRYLRSDGTWQVPPDTNTTYGVATSSSNGLMSSSDKSKLDGIASGANKTTVDSALSSSSTNPVQNKVINSALAGKAASSHSHSAATTSAAGFMSTSDKSKLDGIASGANKYTHPTSSGNKHIPSGGSSGQILRWSADGTAAWGSDNNTTYSNFKGASTSAAGGSGLVPAPAAGASNRYLRSDGTWQVPPDTNTTYGVATTSANGLMSSSDKSKLNGIASGANKYTHPGYTARSSGLYKVTVDSTGHVSAVASVTKSDITALGIPGQDTNTTYGVATTSANGLMSAADKTKLNGIATGANKYTHPTGAGYKHIPSGGGVGKILRWSAAGTAIWDYCETYSTAETDTGNIWVDGKPIYAKMISFTTTSAMNANMTINFDMSNMDTAWIDPTMSFLEYTGTTTDQINPIGYVAADGGRQFMAQLQRKTNKIYIAFDGASSGYIRVLYTKK